MFALTPRGKRGHLACLACLEIPGLRYECLKHPLTSLCDIREYKHRCLNVRSCAWWYFSVEIPKKQFYFPLANNFHYKDHIQYYGKVLGTPIFCTNFVIDIYLINFTINSVPLSQYKNIAFTKNVFEKCLSVQKAAYYIRDNFSDKKTLWRLLGFAGKKRSKCGSWSLQKNCRRFSKMLN